MNRFFTTIFLLFSFLSVFAQDCNLAFGLKINDETDRIKNDSYIKNCKGSKILFTADLIKNATYQWIINGKALTNPISNTFELIGLDNLYSVSVNAKFESCTYSSTIYVTNSEFYDSIDLNIRPEVSKSDTLCEMRKYYIQESSIIGTQYQWQKDGKDIDLATYNDHVIYEKGIYTVRLTRDKCNATSHPLEINYAIVTKEDLIIGNSNFNKDTTIKVCTGTGLFVSLNRLKFNEHDNGLRIFKDNILVSNSRFYQIKESGKYRAELDYGSCKIVSPSVEVIFGNELPKFSLITRNITDCNSLDISWTSIGSFLNPSKTYTAEIYRDKEKLTEIDAFKWQYKVNQFGNYQVYIKNESCQGVSEIINIPTNAKKINDFKFYGTNKKKIELCYGASIGIYSPSSFNNFIYKDGKKLDIGSNNQLSAIKQSGKYYIYKNEGDCYQFSDTLEIILKQKIDNLITLDKEDCKNGIYKLSILKQDGLVYSWKKDGNRIPNLKTESITVKEFGKYSLVINQEFCSIESNEITVGSKIKINSAPCEGQTLQFSSTNTNFNSFEWTGPKEFISKIANPSISNVKLSNQGKYFLKVVDEKNCTYLDSTEIKVNSLPLFEVLYPESICLGKSFTLIGNSPKHNYLSFTFNSPDSENFQSYNKTWTRNNVSSKMAGEYIITGFDYETNCRNTKSINININSESDCPTITIGDLSKVITCEGSETEIPFTTSGIFPPNTVFTVNRLNDFGNLIPMAYGTKSPIKINLLDNSYIIISTSHKNINSASSLLSITNVVPPTIVSTLNSNCSGGKIMLTVDTLNLNYYDYIQWKLNNKKIEGANSYFYNATQSGSYSLEVKINGCIASTLKQFEKQLKFGELEKPRISFEGLPVVCEGSSVLLKCENYPEGMVSFQWNLDGKPIAKMNSSTMQATKKGTYSVTIKHLVCEATSGPQGLVFSDVLPNDIRGLSYIDYTSDKIEICKGTPFELSYNIISYLNISYPQQFKTIPGYTLQWQKEELDIPNENNATYKIEKEGIYRLKILQGKCVAFSKPFQILYTNKEKLNFKMYNSNYYRNNKNEVFLCENDSLYLGISGNNSNRYLRHPSKLFYDNKLRENLSAGYIYFHISKSGDYWVNQNYPIQGTNEVCFAYSDTIHVKIGGQKIEEEASDITSCLDTLMLNAKDYFNLKYKWKYNDNFLPTEVKNSLKVFKSGTYQWEAQSPTCLFVSKPFNVTFDKLVAKLAISKKNAQCYGDNINLYPIFESVMFNSNYTTFPITYQWLKDGVNYSKDQYLYNVDNGIYSLTINQGKCSVTTNPVTVKFNKIPRSISPSDSTFICPNGGLMELNGTNDPSYTYKWFKDNKLLSNQTKSNLKVSETGIYTAQIESGECATLTYPVKVYQNTIRPTAFISSFEENSSSDSTQIKIDLTSSAPWTVKLTNKQTFTVNKTPLIFSVNPENPTIYELASVSNTCGEGTVSGTAFVKMTILGNEEIIGSKINLFPVPTQANCQLTVDLASPEKLDWKLLNSEGRILSKAENHNVSVYHNQNIDLKSFPVGTYILKITIGKQTVSRKIIKLY